MKSFWNVTLIVAILFVAASTASAAAVKGFVGSPIAPDTTRTDVFAQAGWGFFATGGTKQVDQLGYWVSPADSGNTGVLAKDHEVVLYHYNGSNYTKIAGATVKAGSTADASGYAWVTVPTVTLTDTSPTLDFYIVMASFDTDVWAPFTGSAHVPTIDPSFGVRTGNGFAVTPPPAVGGTATFSLAGNTGGYFGGNIGLGVIPEPSSVFLLGFGAVLTWLVSRRRAAGK